MTYLVDANVLSEVTNPVPNPAVVSWLESHETDSAVDPIILGELQIGILTLPRSRKRTLLENWFAEVSSRLVCLKWTAACGRNWANLVARLQSLGDFPPTLDSMIAATALTYNLTLATRNVRDFRMSGVRIVDPFV